MSQFHFIQIGLLVFAFVNITTEFVRVVHAQVFTEIEARRDDVKALNNFKFKSYISILYLIESYKNFKNRSVKL